MSAIPVPGPRTRTRPIPRTRAKSTANHAVRDSLLNYTLAFGLLFGLTYGASSLLGQTMMEQARREGLQARERAQTARKDVAVLRQRVERLVGMRSVEQWATVRGYSLDTTTPGRKPVNLTMVARNEARKR